MIKQLKAVVVAVGTLAAAGALAQDGTRVEIRTSAPLEVEPQSLVQALTSVDGEKKQVKVMRKKTSGGDQLTVDLWGGAAPASEIPGLLRSAFPELAAATITVGVAPAADKPNEADLPAGGEGTVRKRVIIQKDVKAQ